MMFGQMTAGSWIYIGSQGIVQGTYETFVAAGKETFRRQPHRPLDTDRRTGRHGRRATAGRHYGRRLDAGRRVRPDAHRAPPANRLSRPQTDSLDEALRIDREGLPRRPGDLRRPAGQLRRSAAGNRPPRRHARPAHRPDQRPRSAQRLSARRLDAGASPANCAKRTRQRSCGQRGSRSPSTSARCSNCNARGVPTFDYGNNIRQVAKEEGVTERLRFSRLRAGLHPSAVLPRHRTVSLGRAFGRSGRHSQDRCEGEGAHARRSAPAPTGSIWRGGASGSRACRRGFAGLG